MHCQKIKNQSVTKLNLNYEDLFSNDVNKLQEISSIIFENLKEKKRQAGAELCQAQVQLC